MTLSKEMIELLEKKAALYPKNFCGSGFIASVMKDTLTDPAILVYLEALKAKWMREEAEKAIDKGIGIGRRSLIGAPYYPSDEKYIKEETEKYLDQHYPLPKPIK